MYIMYLYHVFVPLYTCPSLLLIYYLLVSSSAGMLVVSWDKPTPEIISAMESRLEESQRQVDEAIEVGRWGGGGLGAVLG